MWVWWTCEIDTEGRSCIAYLAESTEENAIIFVLWWWDVPHLLSLSLSHHFASCLPPLFPYRYMCVYLHTDVFEGAKAWQSRGQACNGVLHGWHSPRVTERQATSQAAMLTDSKGLWQASPGLPDYWLAPRAGTKTRGTGTRDERMQTKRGRGVFWWRKAH